MTRIKRVFAALVALAMTAVCFTACGDDDKDSTSTTESAAEASVVEEEVSSEEESSEEESEAPTEEESSEEASSEEESTAEESAEADDSASNSTSGETVEIYLPAYCASGVDVEELAADSDILDYTVHEDGSITYVSDAASYGEYLAEFRTQIETAIQDELVPTCETITAITTDDDLVDITVVVSNQADYEASVADAYMLSVIGNSYSGMYQILAGNGADWEAVYHIVDGTTDQEFDTLTFDATSLETMITAANAE